MNTLQKIALRQKIIERNSLYELQSSRLKRLLKDPVRTFVFYLLQTAAYVKPFKISYKTLWGSKMSFYLPEASMIYYYGFFEANLSNFLINFLHEGDTVFDVGAHVGFYSILSSDLVGSKGNVYSFEPTPRTYKTLEQNANVKNNIHVYNNAILDKETTIDFYDYGPKYSAFNTFKKRTGEDLVFKDHAFKIEVKTISLDSFVHTHNIHKIEFIKIDAEGSEYLILGSMSHIINIIKPVISLEVSSVEEWSENSEKMIAILEKGGYESYEIALEGTITLCDPRTPRLYDNLLFIHPEKKQFVINRMTENL